MSEEHMNTKNKCKTYFRIVGSFSPDEVTGLLQLQPDKTRSIGDIKANGTPVENASWEVGHCSQYDVIVSNQMEKTISPLLDKIDILKKIKSENDVAFYLEVVPSVYADDINPCLAPSLAVIDFCHATRTEIDIDMYVYNSEQKKFKENKHENIGNIPKQNGVHQEVCRVDIAGASVRPE